MRYTEYKEATQRHLETCKLLQLEIQKTNISLDQKKYYLQELYYLVGYVYECSIKFVFYTYWYKQGLTKNRTAGYRTDLHKTDVEWIADYYRQTKRDANFEIKIHFPFVNITEVETNRNLQLQNNDDTSLNLTWNETEIGLRYILSKFTTTSKVYEYLKNFDVRSVNTNYMNTLLENSYASPIKVLKWNVEERYISTIESKEENFVLMVLEDAETLFKDSKKFHYSLIKQK